jgi:O-antigen ligase
MALGSCATIVWTHSRGGALALATLFIVMLFRSRRKIATLVLIAIIAGPIVYLVRDSYYDRIATMENPEEEGSAASRLLYWKSAIALWKDYPMLGVGFGSANQQLLFPQYTGLPYGQVVHNTYLQLLADSGIIALLIFVYLLFGTIVRLEKSARAVRRIDPKLAVYPVALQTALIGFAVPSTFLSQIRFDFLYILFMTSAVWMQLSKEIIAQSDEDATVQESVNPVEEEQRSAPLTPVTIYQGVA